ncbi:MAG: ABC transporter ATP-binding protein [Pseudomonadota bacterium]
MANLTLQRVSKSFGRFTAVEPTDLTFRHGELTALLGPSGCGKTTLLRMIAGLEMPSSGRLMLGDDDITTRPAHLRKFGMVFQSFALFPHLSVAENVAYSLKISGVGRAEREETAARLLDMVQLSPFATRRIGELSGGQRQRVAIARALAQEPDVFLLDEPMSALDAKLREDMQVELRLLQQRLGITTIVVTHDQREAMTMADQIVVMSQGRAEQIGPPQEIYNRPANAFVASFIGRANFLDGQVQSGQVQVPGTTLSLDAPASFLDGAPVSVAIRPEKAWLDGDMPDGNRLEAKITFVRDVGPTRDIYLETPAGALIVEYAIGENARDFHVGESLQVHLPPGALHVFPRDSDRAAA